MSSITAQQTKLDLELVPKEKRLDIRKCNKRLNPGKIQKQPTFQVVLDALALTPCYSAFLITVDVPEVYMHQDIFKTCPRVQGKDFDALPTDEEIVFFLRDLGHTGEINSLNDVVRNKIGMHTSKDDYLINTLKFVSAKEETQIYGVILPDSLTSPKIKEIKAYKTYIGFDSVSKKKEKVEVTRGKGIELLSQVALTKDAQFEEVQRKSMRDFHKTHPSGFGTTTKPTPSAAIIKPSVTNEGTGVKLGVPDVTEEDSSEKEDEEKIEDDEKKEEEIIKSTSNDSGDEDETKVTDKAEGDEDEEIDYTTSLLYDDADIRLNEPVDTDKGFVPVEGIDAAMTNVQQGNENPEILQVIEDAYVTLSTIPKKTEVPVTSSSHSSDLKAKFLNFSDIPH
ncbi:hypothetical protein Tco_0678837 [Tanacetum coccineum]|uniref:Uncharacterized protein n=1 Tax=Tanacetum coccineum TaxID=301880 RepID=A0ABQ4XG64_9ASTR